MNKQIFTASVLVAVKKYTYIWCILQPVINKSWYSLGIFSDQTKMNTRKLGDKLWDQHSCYITCKKGQFLNPYPIDFPDVQLWQMGLADQKL